MTCIMIVSHTNRLDNFSQSPCTVPSFRLVGWLVGWIARGGVLGWVLDRDAQHRPLTRNATKGEKKGVETIHFAKFWQKVGVEIRHFPHFCTKIGVETIQIFQRPIKGGSKWRSICSNLHRVSTLPGLNRFIYRVNIARAPTWKLATLTG